MPAMEVGDRQRLLEALEFALEAHRGQKRKGTEIPYSSHLLQVAGLVQEHGGDIEQVMAALLHDTLEDCAGMRFETLVERFGRDVAGMVRDCTDTRPGEPPEGKRPWRERKREHLEHLRRAPARSVLVCACDKRHNLGAMVADVRETGPASLDRFNAGAEEQLWLFGSILALTRDRIPARLAREMEALLAELRRLVT